MRINGTLKKWIDDRGFGFVVTAQNSDEIFVHISAFPKDGVRPIVGETISFELQIEKNGKQRAIRVIREAETIPKLLKERKIAYKKNTSHKLSFVLIVIMILAYIANKTDILQQKSSFAPTHKTTKISVAKQPKFKCDGRQHCSQMNSRAEAEYFIKHCPDTKMDGDRDGIPCENYSRF